MHLLYKDIWLTFVTENRLFNFVQEALFFFGVLLNDFQRCFFRCDIRLRRDLCCDFA